MNPYADVKLENNEWIRTFDITTDDQEFIWHRDRKDREIEVLSGDGWKVQRDNEIPFDINNNSKFEIKAMTYHRIIKGNTNLVIKIKEKD